MAPKNSELETNTHIFFLRGVFSNFTRILTSEFKRNRFNGQFVEGFFK